MMAAVGPDKRMDIGTLDDMWVFDKDISGDRRETDTSSGMKMETLVMMLEQGIDHGNYGGVAMVSHPGGTDT